MDVALSAAVRFEDVFLFPPQRQILESNSFTEELARIGDIQRLDEALGAVQLILSHDAEVFPVLKGLTKTRLAKTRAVDDVPALNIWYEIDGDDCVVLMWVEPVPENE